MVLSSAPAPGARSLALFERAFQFGTRVGLRHRPQALGVQLAEGAKSASLALQTLPGTSGRAAAEAI
jgi:hypothetical protein